MRNEDNWPHPEPRLPTPRQRVILALLAQGKSIKVVAHTLGIGESTVKNIVRDARLRMHVNSRSEAIYQLGWICLDQRTQELLDMPSAQASPTPIQTQTQTETQTPLLGEKQPAGRGLHPLWTTKAKTRGDQ